MAHGRESGDTHSLILCPASALGRVGMLVASHIASAWLQAVAASDHSLHERAGLHSVRKTLGTCFVARGGVACRLRRRIWRRSSERRRADGLRGGLRLSVPRSGSERIRRLIAPPVAGAWRRGIPGGFQQRRGTRVQLQALHPAPPHPSRLTRQTRRQPPACVAAAKARHCNACSIQGTTLRKQCKLSQAGDCGCNRDMLGQSRGGAKGLHLRWYVRGWLTYSATLRRDMYQAGSEVFWDGMSACATACW